MLEVLGQDFVRTARAKGLPEPYVVVRHGLANAMVPIVTVMGIMVGEKLSQNYTLEVTNPGGHSSRPVPLPQYLGVLCGGEPGAGPGAAPPEVLPFTTTLTMRPMGSP
jgi:hypothetical protein